MTSIRAAVRADLPAIIALLADDPLGAQRETVADPPLDAYTSAFDAIVADPNHEIVIAASDDAGVATSDDEVIGVLQLSFLPNLTYRGGLRAQIEGVRIARDARGHGVGAQLIQWAIDRAQARGCRLVQLTTNTARPDAVRFYEGLGFEPSHVGMKLDLG